MSTTHTQTHDNQPAFIPPPAKPAGQSVEREPVIVSAPVSEDHETLRQFFSQLKDDERERREAVRVAIPAFDRLLVVMREKTGQAFVVREMLYSLWNGQKADVSNLLLLDWALRKDVCAVLLAFGFEDPKHEVQPFFYNAFKSALTAAGLFKWFTEAFNEDDAP